MIDRSQTLRVEVAHASPGRTRLRLQPENLESPLLRHTEHALRAMPGVTSVRINPRARSLVISYGAPLKGLGQILSALGRAGVDVVQVPRETVVLESLPVVSPAGPTGQMSGRGFGWRRGRNSRRGLARLRTVVPIAIGVVAIRALITGGQVSVPWYLLAALVVNSFLKSPRDERAPA